MDNNAAVCVVGGNLYVLKQSMSAGIRLDLLCGSVVAPIVALAYALGWAGGTILRGVHG